MRSALALLVLLPLLAEGQTYRRPLERRRRGAAVALRVLPAGGGQSQLQQLCDAVAVADKVGSWWCLNGDATMLSGSAYSITAIGSPPPSTGTRQTCPSGPNCSTISVLTSSATADADTGAYQSPSVAMTTTDHSECMVLALGPQQSFENLLFHGNDGTTIDLLWQRQSASDSVVIYSSSGTARFSASLTQRARHLLCSTYQASGTLLSAYLDGVSLGASINVGAQVTHTTPWSIGGYNIGTTFPIKRGTFVAGVFKTDAVLSAARVQQLASATLGSFAGSGGETATITRASSQTCLTDDGTALSVLPSGRPCVSRGLYLSERAQTNLLLRSDDLANAAWTVVGTSVVTGDTWAAPDGTATGDTLTDDDAASKEGVRQVVAATAQDKYTLSCFMQSGTATSAQLVITGTGNAAGDTTCSFSGAAGANGLGNGCSTGGLDGTTRRKCCTTTAAYGAALTNVEGKVTVGTVIGDTGSVKVWGCQLEDGDNGRAYATSYVPTTSSAATRATTILTFPLPATSKPLSLSVRTVPYGFRTAFNQRLGLVIKDASNGIDFYEAFTTGLVQCDFDVGGVFSGGTSTAALTANAMNTASCSYDGTNVRVCANGACNSTARSFTPWSAPVTLYAGSWSSVNYELDGWVGDWCVADSAGGCQ